MGEAVPVAVRVLKPPKQLTSYLTMALLPADAGGMKKIVACALPDAAVTLVGAPGGVVDTTTGLDMPALLVGVFVAVAPPGATDKVPTVGIDGNVSKATPAKFIVTLLVKTKLLGTMKSGGGTPGNAAYPTVPISILASEAPLATLAVNMNELVAPPWELAIVWPEI